MANMPSAPGTPVEGMMYYDSTDKQLKVHDGTEFKTLSGDIKVLWSSYGKSGTYTSATAQGSTTFFTDWTWVNNTSMAGAEGASYSKNCMITSRSNVYTSGADFSILFNTPLFSFSNTAFIMCQGVKAGNCDNTNYIDFELRDGLLHNSSHLLIQRVSQNDPDSLGYLATFSQPTQWRVGAAGTDPTFQHSFPGFCPTTFKLVKSGNNVTVYRITANQLDTHPGQVPWMLYETETNLGTFDISTYTNGVYLSFRHYHPNDGPSDGGSTSTIGVYKIWEGDFVI